MSKLHKSIKRTILNSNKTIKKKHDWQKDRWRAEFREREKDREMEGEPIKRETETEGEPSLD